MKKEFKDACDECGKMAVCKGYKGKVLCPDCRAKIKEEKTDEN